MPSDVNLNFVMPTGEKIRENSLNLSSTHRKSPVGNTVTLSTALRPEAAATARDGCSKETHLAATKIMNDPWRLFMW